MGIISKQAVGPRWWPRPRTWAAWASAPSSPGCSRSTRPIPPRWCSRSTWRCWRSRARVHAVLVPPHTPTTSRCNGTCAQNWPPVQGPATAPGVTGPFGTIKRSNGSTQATFDGHALYTFVGDTGPGQNKGNGLNAFGGLWYEVTTSGSAPADSSSSGTDSGGY
jgi:hypothetical protein